MSLPDFAAPPVSRFRARVFPVIRKLLFWSHLAAGLVFSGVLLVSAFTGAMLALKPVVMARVESSVRRVEVPAGAKRLPAWEWVDLVEEESGAMVTGLQVWSDPTLAPMLLTDGKKSWYIHPVTGEVSRAPESAWRGFFDTMLSWHRWLGVPAAERGAASASGDRPSWRDRASTLVGVSAGGLVLLTLSGLVIWWPRTPNRAAWKFALVPALRRALVPAAGNWHRAVGFWAAGPILLTALTGVALAFPAAADLIGPRPDRRVFAAVPPFDRSAEMADADTLLDSLRRARPGAARYTLSFATEREARPAGGAAKSGAQGVSATVLREEGDLLSVQLTLHPVTGAVVREQLPESAPARVRWRSAVRPLHEGAWGPFAGLAWGLAATLATLTLILTGVILSFHRFRRRRRSA